MDGSTRRCQDDACCAFDLHTLGQRLTIDRQGKHCRTRYLSADPSSFFTRSWQLSPSFIRARFRSDAEYRAVDTDRRYVGSAAIL